MLPLILLLTNCLAGAEAADAIPNIPVVPSLNLCLESSENEQFGEEDGSSTKRSPAKNVPESRGKEKTDESEYADQKPDSGSKLATSASGCSTSLVSNCSLEDSSREQHNEWIVLQFRVESNYQAKDNYTMIVMTAHAVSAKAPVSPANRCMVVHGDEGTLRVVVPHTHGNIRSVQLKSDCVERIQRQPLNEMWPIEPSWCYSPLSFDNPIHTRNGEGTIDLTVDSKRIASADFKLDPRSTNLWSNLNVFQA